MDYVTTPDGNIVNEGTRWNITGTLIKKITLSETDILCNDRTLLVPVRYRTFNDAMTVCEQLGEIGLYDKVTMFCLFHILGSFLDPFTNFQEYEALYNAYKKNPAMNAFCSHGNRYMLWLPFSWVGRL